MSMLGEISHLQTLTDDLHTLTLDPHKLPASSEQVSPTGLIMQILPMHACCLTGYDRLSLGQVIVDLKGSDSTWCYQTPPSSPSTTVSRKSSMCRLVSLAKPSLAYLKPVRVSKRLTLT